MSYSLMFKMILSVVGGLGIFLLGMKNMSEGIQAIAGNRMRKLINAITNNRLVACGGCNLAKGVKGFPAPNNHST